MLRVICGLRYEFIGLERIPPGAAIVASKHQSLWETFALMLAFQDPAYILKRELMWIPFFGWCAWKTDMIPVDRGKRSQALSGMTDRARIETQRGRQHHHLSRRHAPSARRRAEIQVRRRASLCRAGVPCVPVALNSGLFWPRRSFMRYPGTIRVEILDPIRAGARQRRIRGAAAERDRDRDRASDRRRPARACASAAFVRANRLNVTPAWRVRVVACP